MYLSKRKVILVTSISVLVFFFTYTDIKSQDIRIEASSGLTEEEIEKNEKRSRSECRF